jgi:hypothetical protein
MSESVLVGPRRVAPACLPCVESRISQTCCLGEESVVVGLESDSKDKHLLFWELQVEQINQCFNTERKRRNAIIHALGAVRVVNESMLRDSSAWYATNKQGSEWHREWSVRA